jgi:hypothetical protein
MLSVSVYAGDKDFDGTNRNPIAQQNADNDSKASKNLDSASDLNDVSKRPAFETKQKVKDYVEDDYNGNWITWNKSDNFTLYKGQKLYCDYTVNDVWKNFYTIPFVEVYNSDFKLVKSWAPADPDLIVSPYSYDRYTGYLDIKSAKLKAGLYYIAICAMPCDKYGYWAGNLDLFDIPMEVVTFKVKAMPKPTKLKVVAGKKRVTVSYKKSAGAQKYEIYRSVKKGSGYKKIATIKGAKYTDKKVKKGKRYYYKVRAVRGATKSGIARSAFTTPIRSKKVKK